MACQEKRNGADPPETVSGSEYTAPSTAAANVPEGETTSELNSFPVVEATGLCGDVVFAEAVVEPIREPPTPANEATVTPVKRKREKALRRRPPIALPHWELSPWVVRPRRPARPSIKSPSLRLNQQRVSSPSRRERQSPSCKRNVSGTSATAQHRLDTV